ncbi:MAG TPA: DUF711 family protein [Anaerolineae bacterium]|nr:DUF711 family protein [Anaerolineae bacterium]
MRIRSITCFYNPLAANAELNLQNMGKLAQKAWHDFEKEGFEVQTSRFATPSLLSQLQNKGKMEIIQFAKHLEKRASEQGFNYLSLGTAPIESPSLFEVIPDILAETENTFLSATIANQKPGISPPAVKACARIIKEISTISSDGFTNLRFAALANVPPFTPFFPAAYSEGNEKAFTLAIECADVAIIAFQKSTTLKEARLFLLQTLEGYAKHLKTIAINIEKEFGATFKGFDFSLAPFPKEWCSLGRALELLGLPKLGYAGSLAASAFLADTLDRGKWKKAGFNGLMLPMLEDSTLAARAAEGTLGIYDLLQYSAVCGTGLDTIPLPGAITPEELTPLLLDIAALALRLDKPLTARLMPIPGKQAGEPTDFNFDFFANSKVINYHVQPLQGLLNQDNIIQIKSKKIPN